MKIGFLITARLKSSRLPYKVLKDLNGKSVIEHIIDRSKMIHEISDIILCTSTNPQDKPLADIALKNGIYCFNGSEEDVMSRLLGAAKFYGLDYFIGITADNPLFSIYHSNLIIDEIKKNEYDFIKVTGLPLGCGTYGMSVKALETVCRVKNIVDTEIWGRLIDRPEIFCIKELQAEGRYNSPDLRLTLDYLEDYEVLSSIYSNIKYDNCIDLYQAINYLQSNDKINDINKNCIQFDLDENTINEINKRFTENYDEILKVKSEIYE